MYANDRDIDSANSNDFGDDSGAGGSSAQFGEDLMELERQINYRALYHALLRDRA